MCNPNGTRLQKAIYWKLENKRAANKAEATDRVSSDLTVGSASTQGSQVRALQQLSTNQLRVRSSTLNVT